MAVVNSVNTLGDLARRPKRKKYPRKPQPRLPTRCCFCDRPLTRGGAFRFRDPNDNVEKSRCISIRKCSGWYMPFVV